MGTYVDGILGKFQGKIGAVIGSKWRGVHYMRSKGSPRRSGFSVRQLQQQARFALGIRFLQPLHPVLKIGYQTQANGSTALNQALSDVIREAVVGEYPDYSIDFTRLRLAKGTLSIAFNPAVAWENGGIRFSWAHQSSQAGGDDSDLALLVAIGENGEATYSMLQFRRAEQSALLAAPFLMGSRTIHCYIAMVSATENVSNSLYAGALAVG